MQFTQKLNDLIKTTMPNPKYFDDFIDKEQGKETLVNAIINYALVGIIASIIYAVITVLFSLLIGGIGGRMDIALNLALVMIPLQMAITILIPVLLCLPLNALYWLAAKIFGGKGSYTAQTYYVSFTILGMLLPGIGSFLALYHLYLTYKIHKKIHKLDTGRAIVATCMPLLLLVIAIVVALIYLR